MKKVTMTTILPKLGGLQYYLAAASLYELAHKATVVAPNALVRVDGTHFEGPTRKLLVSESLFISLAAAGPVLSFFMAPYHVFCDIRRIEIAYRGLGTNSDYIREDEWKTQPDVFFHLTS